MGLSGGRLSGGAPERLPWSRLLGTSSPFIFLCEKYQTLGTAADGRGDGGRARGGASVACVRALRPARPALCSVACMQERATPACECNCAAFARSSAFRAFVEERRMREMFLLTFFSPRHASNLYASKHGASGRRRLRDGTSGALVCICGTITRDGLWYAALRMKRTPQPTE